MNAQKNQEVGALPTAKVMGLNPGNGSTSSLELRVSIEGQDHDVLLPLDALDSYGLSGPAVVVELRALQKALTNLRDPVGRLAGATDKLQAVLALQESK